MANWQFKLELGDAWQAYDEDENVQKLAGTVAERIKALVPSIKRVPTPTYRRMAGVLEKDILPMFEEVRDDESMGVEDFDSALENLYDWADTRLDNEWNGRAMCWIDTLKAPAK
jgi:hypothetical protein